MLVHFLYNFNLLEPEDQMKKKGRGMSYD